MSANNLTWKDVREFVLLESSKRCEKATYHVSFTNTSHYGKVYITCIYS